MAAPARPPHVPSHWVPVQEAGGTWVWLPPNGLPVGPPTVRLPPSPMPPTARIPVNPVIGPMPEPAPSGALWWIRNALYWLQIVSIQGDDGGMSDSARNCRKIRFAFATLGRQIEEIARWLDRLHALCVTFLASNPSDPCKTRVQNFDNDMGDLFMDCRALYTDCYNAGMNAEAMTDPSQPDPFCYTVPCGQILDPAQGWIAALAGFQLEYNRLLTLVRDAQRRYEKIRLDCSSIPVFPVGTVSQRPDSTPQNNKRFAVIVPTINDPSLDPATSWGNVLNTETMPGLGYNQNTLYSAINALGNSVGVANAAELTQ